jgi:two-component system nitrate/nitrite response regulator NarL
LASLKSVAAGKLVLSPGVADLLPRALRQDGRPRTPDRAGLTEGTVKVHVKNLLNKLHPKSRTEAAVGSVEHGVPD